MKGTRTYQIAIIALVFVAIGVLNYLGIRVSYLKDIGEQGIELFDIAVKAYVAYLAVFKTLKPHPMKHQKKNDV